MTDAEDLVIRNLLNGIPPAHAGLAAGLAEDEVNSLFAQVMRRVAEYALVHCVPLIECTSLPAARRNKRAVLDVLASIARWDRGERDLVLAIFKGRNVMKDGVSRETAEAALNRTLDALPNYLGERHVTAYGADRQKFVRENRSLVIGALEKFVSFREPFLYQRITHDHITVKDLA